jgi:RHS repeat-associated protein
VTSFGYDGSGRLTSVTNALGSAQQTVTQYQYDEAGNEIAQIDALNRTNTYVYDGMGRRLQHLMPGGQSESLGYDFGGNLIRETNFNNVIITNQYDVMNRLTNCASVNGYQVSYAFTLTGQRQLMIDPSGLTAYGYDLSDRLQTKTMSWNSGPSVSLNYAYDFNGNVTNIWATNGVNLAYSYDPLNRLTNVLANGSPAAGYAFDGVGNLQALRYGNGATNLNQYDSLNRLTNSVWNLNASSLVSFHYQLGSTGNRTNLSETVNSASRGYAWKYDALYRLTNETLSVTAPTGVLGYSYDVVGNRLSRNSTVSASGMTNQAFTFNTNDWISGDSYDTNGNTVASFSNTYKYDVMNHLTNFNSGAVLLGYDGDGNRVSKKKSGAITYYLVDDRNASGYAQVLEELTVSGSVTKVYNYGLSLISQQIPGTSTNFFGYDGHGSTRFLTSLNGNVTDTYTYDAFGNIISVWYAGSGPTSNNYLYCCQQFDPDFGLYYFRARYGNPNTGRFCTMDTYAGNNEDPLSLHKYLYAQDNPVDMLDPSGHEETAEVGLAGSEGAAIDAGALPVISRVYMTTFNTLMRVRMAQNQIVFALNATLVAAAALEVGAGVMDRVANRLLKNTAAIPAGNWSYGKSLEKTALQSEDGYLGGTVSKIDYFDKNSGLGISFKAHGLSSSMPNLGDRLLVSIQRDLQKVSDVKVTGARGITESGLNVNIAGSQIKQTILTVAVPESQAETVLSSTFQQTLLEYEQFYETEIEVIPVQGWMR